MTSTSAGPRIVPSDEGLPAVLVALGLEQATPVVVLAGGARGLEATSTESSTGVAAGTAGDGEATRARELTALLLEQVLGPVARERPTVVLTGGTHVGVMALAGEILRDDARLVGVVPESKVTGDDPEAQLDPNHHVAVLTAGESWGSETDTLYDLAQLITGGNAPGLVLVSNGGDVTKREVGRFLRAGWPVLLLDGSGGTATEIAAIWSAARATRTIKSGIIDPDATTFGDLTNADVEILRLVDVDAARRQLNWRLEPNELLKTGWARYDALERATIGSRAFARRASRLTAGAFLLLLTTIAALVQMSVLRWLDPDAKLVETAPAWVEPGLQPLVGIMNLMVIALPVAIAVAATLGTFLGTDHRWRVLRQAAESTKVAIYRYRAGLTEGNVEERARSTARYTSALSAIDEQLLAAGAPFATARHVLLRGRPKWVDPDEIEPLTAQRYLKIRVEGQLRYYRDASRERIQREIRFVTLTATAAGVAAVLAGTQFAVWIAFLLVLVGGVVAHRQRQQTREQLAGFDRAVAEIDAVRLRWAARQISLTQLVESAEKALERQGSSWSENLRRAAEQDEHYGAGAPVR